MDEKKIFGSLVGLITSHKKEVKSDNAPKKQPWPK